MDLTFPERPVPPPFQSLEYARSETRRLLRARFQRALGFEIQPPMPRQKAADLADEDMVRLLESFDLPSGSDEATAREIYEAALPQDGQQPAWDEIVALGWVRRVWGRYVAHYDLYAAAKQSPSLTALGHWMANRYDQPPRLIASAAQLPDCMRELASRLTTSEQNIRHVTCVDPAWVAARLWDRNWRQAASPEAALRWWVDRWNLLASPELIPTLAWDPEDAVAFRDAAFAVIEGEPDLLDWVESRSRFVRQAALARGGSNSSYEQVFDPAPDGVVARVLWLQDYRQEAPVHHGLEAAGDLIGLARLLWAEVDAEPNAQAPHPIAARLLTLALGRPELLASFLYPFKTRPELLADVLLYPPMAGLACLLIAQADSPRASFDRELIGRDYETARTAAFKSAVAILAWFLARGEVPTRDATDLLAWLHKQAPAGFIDAAAGAEPLRAALNSELITLPGAVIAAMIETLLSAIGGEALEPAAFAALLELAEIHPITAEAQAQQIAESYVADLATSWPRIRTGRIGVAGATALLTLPLPPEERHRLLSAVNVRDRLSTAPPDHNPYVLDREIGSALRAHIRMLCRATTGLGRSTPSDLSNALVDAIEAGAERNPDKGKVPAFAPPFEQGDFAGTQDRTIAEDLAAALRALDDSDRARLLRAILKTDEPMVLARLYPLAPTALQAQIKERLEDLPPDKAAHVFSLKDLQARAASLLAAGLTGPAAVYMAAEREAKPRGPVAGRALTQFVSDLRFKFANSDWDGITATIVPEDMPQAEAADARDSLSFYRGLAFLLRTENRATDAAEQIFADLLHRKPHVKAYALNLIAARVVRLLPDDLFARLDDADARRARQVLSDNERLIGDRAHLNPEEQATLAGNEALLYLAVGEPATAFAVIAGVSSAHSDPRALGYQAVALSRLGRKAEAATALKTAEEFGGSTAFFEAVRAHIETGGPVALPVTVTAREDRVRGVREALLDLLQLNAQDQAVVMGGRHATLETYLTDQVREAAGSLIRLVPMTKGIVLSDCEDDLNALLGEFLHTRLQVLKWYVPDQSKGGFSGKGNAGERDLIVKRDAAELCAIEAVICEDPVKWEAVQKNLRKHFQKLFGYGASRVLYHVTYAYGADLPVLWSFLKTMSEKEAPTGFVFTDRSDLETIDSRPGGFKAQYSIDGDAITVVFLVLELGQERQRAAAVEARK